MSKINPKAKSKLSGFVANKSQTYTQEKYGFVVPDKHKKITKSFRLNSIDLEKLNKTVHQINNNSPYKNYTESEIIRGLISLSGSLPTKKILKALEERGS